MGESEYFGGREETRSGPSTASARSLLLRTYRDLLTEAFFRGPEGTPTPSRILDIGMPHWEASGVVGVAFGQGDASAEPDLLLLAKTETDISKTLLETLRKNGVPVELRTGVTFKAAARPIAGGQSIGFGVPLGGTGTMGCVVKARSDGSLFALSCNHVIADLNKGSKSYSEVWAPGAKQSGTSADRLGVLHDFAQIDFAAGAYNVIDAALAKPDDPNDISDAIDLIGRPTGVNAALAFGDRVQKTGVSTGHTVGKYRYSINALVGYADGSTALFRDLIGIVGLTRGKDFGAPGDSGAVILDDTKAVVGQLISVAAGIDLTLASAIKPVLDHFQVDLGR